MLYNCVQLFISCSDFNVSFVMSLSFIVRTLESTLNFLIENVLYKYTIIMIIIFFCIPKCMQYVICRSHYKMVYIKCLVCRSHVLFSLITKQLFLCLRADDCRGQRHYVFRLPIHPLVLKNKLTTIWWLKVKGQGHWDLAKHTFHHNS